MIKKYQLDFQKAKNYFYKKLKGTNKFSNYIISLINLESGDFFALFTENAIIEDINDFTTGGKTSCLINHVGEFIYKILKSNKNISCIFDDFNSDKKNTEGVPFVNQNFDSRRV